MERQMNGGENVETWRPVCDIFEMRQGWRVVVELPGVAENDVAVECERGVLTVEGRRTTPAPAAGMRLLHGEQPCGVRFRRQFQLSDDIDTSAIKAQIRDGVLRLELPRAQATMAKKIAVTAG